jgi:branched-chain amino acid transport system substrate-binding protein
MNPIKQLLVPMAIVSIGAGVLASCGAGTATRAKAATAEPIYIGLDNVVVQSKGSAQQTPEAYPDMQAAVQQINKHGGIKGRPLAIKQCDNHFTPAGSAACIRQFADDPSVVAMVGVEDDCFSDGSAAVLKQSGLLMLRAIACQPGDLTSPQITSIDNGLILTPIGIGTVAAQYKTVSLIGYNLPQSDVLIKLFSDAIKAAGGKVEHVVRYDPTTVDLSAAVSTAIQGNPGAIGMTSGEAQLASAIAAASQQGYKGKIVVGAAQMSAKTLASLGSTANNVIGVATLAPIMAPNAAKTIPAIGEYQREVSAVGAPETPQGFEAWLTVYQFRDVAEKASKMDRAGLLEALRRLTNWSYLGSNLPVDFSKPGPFPDAPNVRTHWGAVLVADNGQWVWNGKWVDVAPTSSSTATTTTK